MYPCRARPCRTPITGKRGGAEVLLMPASPGTGVIAGGGVRAVLEAAGVRDILSKSQGSANILNVAHATIQALDSLIERRRRGADARQRPGADPALLEAEEEKRMSEQTTAYHPGEKPDWLSRSARRRRCKALGLGKMNSSVLQNDTPPIRGMITKISHLVKVEEVES